MKRPIQYFVGLVVFISLLITACERKKSSGISPTYGTSGNPNPSLPTVTGNATLTNPATENTSLPVGGTGWTNPTCPSTNSLNLIGYFGNTNVTLNFASVITTGTYNIGPVASSANSICAMSIVNAPNQPSGVAWYGKSGVVFVNATGSSINASFSNVVCTQASFNFPTVTASGQLGCSQ